MTIKVLSLDVFDTCLIRKCGIPEKIWDIMLNHLFDKNDSSSRITFKAQRKNAESIAQEKNPYPTISDIYDSIDLSQWNLNKDSVIHLEEKIEKEQLVANSTIRAVIAEYRKKGYYIFFISDMYLSSSFIKSLLKQNKIMNDEDKLFVSNELNASKKDGTLFDIIKFQQNVSFKNWIHIGDNNSSDFFVPKKKGITAKLYSGCNYSDYEKKWLEDASFYSDKNGIEFFTGLSRTVRLLNGNSPQVAFAANVISSIYVPYVCQILQEANKQKISNLFFLARDGHIFLQIAEQFKELFPNISLHYLYISRRSVYPCVFYCGSTEEIAWILSKAKGHRLEKALQHMGFSWEDLFSTIVPPFKKDDKLSDENTQPIASYLSDSFSELIRKKSQLKRDLLIKYLIQENFFYNKQKAIVDLGWEGSTRICLNKILTTEQAPPTFAFYLGYSKTVKQSHKNDNIYFFQNQTETTIPISTSLFEHYFSANIDGTTLGYKKDNNQYVAILDKNHPENEKIQNINEGIAKQIALGYSQILKYQPIQNHEIFLCCGKRTLQEVSSTPKYSEAKLFFNKYTENFGEKIPLIRELSLKDIVALLIWNSPPKTTWVPAAISLKFKDHSSLFKKICSFSSNMTPIIYLKRVWTFIKK